ncbi:MAG: hypothetical protein LBH03_01470 [Holophagales bacterium]|jgi:hypothetical protein|nr:hypothetical protein [Holophagales bacterium]
MTALTCDRDTPKRIAALYQDPVAAGYQIFAGAIVVIDPNGFVRPGGAMGIARGMALKSVDNRLGGDGDCTVEIESGCFGLKTNGTINRTHIGKPVYLMDDQAVGATGPYAAGILKDVEGKGNDAIAWVDVG